jgi:hypothetical protein
MFTLQSTKRCLIHISQSTISKTEKDFVRFYRCDPLEMKPSVRLIYMYFSNVDPNHFDYSLNSHNHHYRTPSPDFHLSPSHCLLHAYDFYRQRWRFINRLPEIFSHVSFVSTNTTLYLFGGQLRSGELSDRIWILSLSTLKWHMSPIRLPYPRGQHTCVLFHNVVLLFFGITNSSSSSNSCRSVDMFDLKLETWACLGESVPAYQCEPIVATGHRLLLSDKNDTQMLHTYKLTMQRHDELTNGQALKMTTSNDELKSTASTTMKDKTQLSRVS